MQRYVPFLVLAVCAACSRQAAFAPPPESRAERLAVLDRIAAECRVPRAMMTLTGEDDLRLNPPADLEYERMECVLRNVERLNLPPSAAGLVAAPANASVPEANDAAPH